MQAAADLFATIPLFERLELPLRQRIAAIGETIVVGADHVLSQQGAMATHLHVLLEGQVALSSTAADGTTALVEVLHPLDHFVLAAVLTRLPHLMTARTVGPARLVAIDSGRSAGHRATRGGEWPTPCCIRSLASSAPWFARYET